MAFQSGTQVITKLDGTERVLVDTAGAVNAEAASAAFANLAAAGSALNPALAAAGTNLATAAQLLPGTTLVSASDGTKGVKLPATPAAGTKCTLLNSVAAQPLIIYPDAAATINGIGSHGALTCANGVPVILFATSATQWYTLPLVPS